MSELLWHPGPGQLTLCLSVGTECLGWDTCLCSLGERTPKGLQAEKEAVAPSSHLVGEVRVGFGQGRGPGLPESEEISDAAQ